MRVALTSAIVGFVLITVGCFLAWHPLGYIAAGSLLLAAAIKGHKN